MVNGDERCDGVFELRRLAAAMFFILPWYRVDVDNAAAEGMEPFDQPRRCLHVARQPQKAVDLSVQAGEEKLG